MQSRSTNFSIFFFNLLKITVLLMKFVHLKQFLGIEMISGVLKNRLSGLDDSN